LVVAAVKTVKFGEGGAVKIGNFGKGDVVVFGNAFFKVLPPWSLVVV
jgi:hypothetical protein